MKKKTYIIKYFSKANSAAQIRSSNSRIIVVSYNVARLNGPFIEKIGIIFFEKYFKFGYLNLERLGFWLNKGGIIKNNVCWIVSFLASLELWNLNKKNKINVSL